MAQIVVLILLAQLGGGAGPARQPTQAGGRFLSMEACRESAAKAVAIHPQPEIKVSYLCVPLTGSAR